MKKQKPFNVHEYLKKKIKLHGEMEFIFDITPYGEDFGAFEFTDPRAAAAVCNIYEVSFDTDYYNCEKSVISFSVGFIPEGHELYDKWAELLNTVNEYNRWSEKKLPPVSVSVLVMKAESGQRVLIPNIERFDHVIERMKNEIHRAEYNSQFTPEQLEARRRGREEAWARAREQFNLK